MKKRMIWLMSAGAIFSWSAWAEMVISSPTGLPDESDVMLEAVVDSVKEIPSDTVKVVLDTWDYTVDDLRNSAHGITSVFKGSTPREAARRDMLNEVSETWDLSGDIVFRSYKISPEIAKLMQLKGISEGAFSDMKPFFTEVDFPEGASAFFQPEYRQLMVRNTPANLAKIEGSLATYHHAEEDYKQVEIKAKFIEVSQTTLNQLGFSWRIEDAGGALRLWDHAHLPDNQSLFSAGLRAATQAFGASVSGAGSLVMTSGGWMPLSVAITALEQASDSDVLSSPSITTKDGGEAEIWVGEDRMVPESFAVNSAEVNIHIQHTDWDSQLMGVYFGVTPEILENDIIRLELKPKIIDLLGYDHYQVSPEASMLMVQGSYAGNQQFGRYPIMKYAKDGVTDTWNKMFDTLTGVYDPQSADPNNMHKDDGEWTAKAPTYGYHDTRRKAQHDDLATPLNAVYGSLPYFRIREIETTVDVADGSTVGLGGLIYDRIETYKDKVPVLGSIPFLGRLFRSEGERSIKRNLMIFVSATQVADNGTRKSDVATAAILSPITNN